VLCMAVELSWQVRRTDPRHTLASIAGHLAEGKPMRSEGRATEIEYTPFRCFCPVDLGPANLRIKNGMEEEG
jgi:hypothetical protein